jgi:hypothetical protein
VPARFTFGATLALTLVALVALLAGARRAVAAEPDLAPVWIAGPDGVRFRVRFDPGERLLVGAALDGTPSTGAPALEIGLRLRSAPPPVGWDVYWKRDHELAHFVWDPTAGGWDLTAGARPAMSGVLYRGLFLRQSREGTLTLPLSPPVALALPFDIGLAAEIVRFNEATSPVNVGRELDVDVVHGEVVADFLRSRHPGRWLLLGVGGRYEVGLSRDAAGALLADHRVSPMTALSVALHGERADGLLAGGLRAEGARRWSSARGWESAFRIDGEAEVTPIALNDRPVSLFAAGTAESGADLAAPDLRLLVGLRFSQPLR